MDVKINIYQSGGQWYGARWIDGEYDGCDQLDLTAGASEKEAFEAAEREPLTVDGQTLSGPWSVSRVADVSA